MQAGVGRVNAFKELLLLRLTAVMANVFFQQSVHAIKWDCVNVWARGDGAWQPTADDHVYPVLASTNVSP